MRKHLKILIITLITVFSFPLEQSKAMWATEGTQITHTANNLWSSIMNQSSWVMDRIEQLNQLAEMIRNNFLTETIRGFNELMTAIQTDISDVFGTLSSLVNAPMDLFRDLTSLPNSVFSLIKNLPGSFLSLFNEALDTFSIISEAQTLGRGMSDIFSRYGGAYGFMNEISGLRTRINTEYLKGSEQRQRMFKQWEKKDLGENAIEILSNQAAISAETAKAIIHGQEMMAMDRLQQAADRAAIEEMQKAHTGKVAGSVLNHILTGFNP